MRRLCTSDWQLTDNPRDRYRTDFVVKTLPGLIVKHQADQLLVLGDVTEEKDRHPAPLVNEIANALSAIAGFCEVIVLQGNHDFLHNGFPFFAFLENVRGINWISKPEILDNCLYLPHTRDHKADWKGIDFKGHDYIFAHNIFTGVNAANGHALAGISPSIFPKDAMVISGDVHEPQTFGVITYVGSPCLCDFGDDYQPRVLLLDGLTAKSIKVYGQQKRLIWGAVNKVAGQRELAFDHNANAGDIVKIQVEMTRDDVPEWAAIRKEAEQWAIENKFVVNTIQPIVAYVQGARQKIVKSSRKVDNEYLEAFVQRLGIDERTAQTGKELMEE